jgi:hypothetical protein
VPKPRLRSDRPRGPYDRSLRAADADREAVANILRREHLAGRFSLDEFEERYSRCLTATTYEDLDALLADLPDRGSGQRVPAWHASSRTLVLALLSLVLISGIVLSGGRLFWLAIPVGCFLLLRSLLWRSPHASWVWGCGPRHGSGAGTDI